MKNIVLSLFLSLVSGSLLCGQTTKQKMAPAKAKKEVRQKEQPAVRAKEITENIHSVCVLQGDQSAKINILFTEYYTKHDALKKQKNMLDKKVYSEKVKSLKRAKEQKFMSILTAEQLKKWSLYKLDSKKDDKEGE